MQPHQKSSLEGLGSLSLSKGDLYTHFLGTASDFNYYFESNFFLTTGTCLYSITILSACLSVYLLSVVSLF